jgi:hypothetical protein
VVHFAWSHCARVLEPQAKALLELESTAAPEPEQGTVERELTEADKPPPAPPPTPEVQPIVTDNASAFRKTDSFTWAFSKPKRLSTEADSAPITNPEVPVAPEATEAIQDPRPTEADSESRADKNEKSLEDQITSIQSLISNWLKRP